MNSLIQVLLARAEHVYEETEGLNTYTNIDKWDFSGLKHQAEELLNVIQAIETLRRAQELTEE